jgi:murein DD-endopeptidase MepM/ murein hydrolase activator NlpD
VKALQRFFVMFLVGLTLVSPLSVVAQGTGDTASGQADEGSTKEEIDDLNQAVKDKQKRLKDLDASIGKYKERIKQQEGAVASLQNQVSLLENRIQEKQLAVERAKEQIALTNLEVQALTGQIELDEARLLRRRESLGEILRRIHEAEGIGFLESFLARPSLSDLAARIDQFTRLEQDLTDATEALHEAKDRLIAQKQDLEKRRLSLQEEQTLLLKEQRELESDRSAKVSLVAETQSQESEFQKILYELRQQQQEEAGDIAALEEKLKDKLDEIDEALARGDILLNWPISVSRISAHFHDPSYPFRHLFEHPGTDIPTPVGTPVRAAAGGYVAWNRLGKQYGNYVMIVHPGGVATVYAHLSKFGAKVDTYVERGDIIGYSGGKAGAPGSGLSTGPHLHFEVRQNGIPVKPEHFLPSLD